MLLSGDQDLFVLAGNFACLIVTVEHFMNRLTK